MDRIIATTILEQLGGKQFVMMTGCKNFIALENGIKMQLCKNASKANSLIITLNGMDLYDVRFCKTTKPTLKNNFRYDTEIIKVYNDVYFDTLQDIFTSTTGLYTTLR